MPNSAPYMWLFSLETSPNLSHALYVMKLSRMRDEEWVWNNAVQVKDKVCACLSCVHTRHNDEDGLILREKKML